MELQLTLSVYFAILWRSSLATFTCPTLFNWYPDMYDCSKFYRCMWGKSHSFDCPQGTLWSQKLLTCDHADHVKCSSDSASQVAHGGHNGYKNVEAPDFSVDYEIHLETHHGDLKGEDSSSGSYGKVSYNPHSTQEEQHGSQSGHGGTEDHDDTEHGGDYNKQGGHDYESDYKESHSTLHKDPEHEHSHSVFDYHANNGNSEHVDENYYHNHDNSGHDYDYIYYEHDDHEGHSDYDAVYLNKQSSSQNTAVYDHGLQHGSQQHSQAAAQHPASEKTQHVVETIVYPQYVAPADPIPDNGHGHQTVSQPAPKVISVPVPVKQSAAPQTHIPPSNHLDTLKLGLPIPKLIQPEQYDFQQSKPQPSFLLKKPPNTIVLKPGLVSEPDPLQAVIDSKTAYDNFILGKLLSLPRYGGHFYHQMSPVNTDGTYDVLELEVAPKQIDQIHKLEPYKAKIPASSLSSSSSSSSSDHQWQTTDLFRAGYGYKRIFA